MIRYPRPTISSTIVRSSDCCQMFWIVGIFFLVNSIHAPAAQAQTPNQTHHHHDSNCSQCQSHRDWATEVVTEGIQRRPVVHGGITYYAVDPQLESSEEIFDTTGRPLNFYRKILRQGTKPSGDELIGKWRGVNRGVVEVVGLKQFIKEIRPDQHGRLYGDNINVHQVKPDQVRYSGWREVKQHDGEGVQRTGKFAVVHPPGKAGFSRGVLFSYKHGGNPPADPSKLLLDRVVKIDDDHMIGRASANFGLFRIPLSFFVLERIEDE